MEAIAEKINQNQNMIRRNLGECSSKIKVQAYLSLVRPILEYGQTVWDPYHQKHIERRMCYFERVQRKAILYVMTNCQRNSNERKSWMANSTAEAMRCQTHNVSQNNEQLISGQNTRLWQETKKTTPRTTCPKLHQHPEQHWFLPVLIWNV